MFIIAVAVSDLSLGHVAPLVTSARFVEASSASRRGPKP